MTAQDTRGSSPVARLLAEAQSKAESGSYADAIAAVRNAKTLEPKNVYILAFERQAEQLHELQTSNALTDEQRGDILESIPSIIEKAVELSRTSSGVTNVSGLGRPLTNLETERQEKAAALEWLKNQYFQHAHEYVRKGEYSHALAEIHRIYIIDPGNKVAKDFEKQIDQLAVLKTQHVTKIHLGIAPPGIARPGLPPATDAMKERGSRLPDSEPLPIMTEEWSSPQQLLRTPPKPAAKAPEPRAKKKGNGLLVFLIILTVIVVVAAIFWYYQRAVSRKIVADPTALSPPVAERFLGAPVQTAEQSFVVSASAPDSASNPRVTRIPDEDNRGTDLAALTTDGTGSRTMIASPGGDESVQNKREPDESGRLSMTTPLQAVTTAPEQEQPLAVASLKSKDTAEPPSFVDLEKQASIIKLEDPKFSSFAYERGIEGQIVIQVQIDQNGTPTETVTLKSTNDVLIEPVIAAVMNSRFAPARMPSGPVSSWITIPFKFSRKQ